MYRWFYCRISTKRQSLKKQVEAAKDYAKNHHSAKITDKFITEQYSGAKRRPKFEQMIKALRPKDQVIVVRLDRFSRSLRLALNAIHAIKLKNCSMKVLTPFPMWILKPNKQGKITEINETRVDMLLLFAQWERKAITHRTHLAIKINKIHRKGFKVGRKSRTDPRNQWKYNYKAIYDYSKTHSVTATARHFPNFHNGKYNGKHISRREVYYIKNMFGEHEGSKNKKKKP